MRIKTSSFLLAIMSYKWLRYASSLKVIALHGKGNTGESFQKKIEPFVAATKGSAEWIFPTAPHSVEDGMAWWLLPPGVRTYNAEKLEGVEESIKMIEDLYPFDAIIGHSQGAMLAAILIARGLSGESEVKPNFAILSGSAWPAPFSTLLDSIPPTSVKESELQSLHIIGDKDDMNPPVQAMRLGKVLQGEIYTHPGGHVLPVDMTSIKKYCSFLKI
mmetsp:Transcript_5589/g.5778  ORF Transcript_5589/g.5778 Transcript_5589/m.5778 type:complete len:217 (+) Transcript_5589:50-700(+)